MNSKEKKRKKREMVYLSIDDILKGETEQKVNLVNKTYSVKYPNWLIEDLNDIYTNPVVKIVKKRVQKEPFSSFSMLQKKLKRVVNLIEAHDPKGNNFLIDEVFSEDEAMLLKNGIAKIAKYYLWKLKI